MQRAAHLFSISLVVLFLATFLGCSARPSSGEGSTDFGRAALMVSGATAESIAGITVTVSAYDIPRTDYALSKVDGQWQGVIDPIKAGTGRSFHAVALDAGGSALFEGEAANVLIEKGTTASIVIVLQQLGVAPPFSNRAPRITAIAFSSTAMAPSQTIAVRVDAVDDDGDPIFYNWFAPIGSFDNSYVASTTWTAPTYERDSYLSVSVRDSKGAAVTAQVPIAVRANPDTGTAVVKVRLNSWPVVRSITIDGSSNLAVGGTATVLVDTYDADGDSLSYQWSHTCTSGSFDSFTGRNVRFTLTGANAAANCDLRLDVSDERGGTGSGTLTIQTAAPPVFVAPLITLYQQSSNEVSGGDTVDFEVTAFTETAAPLAFSWTASDGTLGSPSSSARTSAIRWTAPGHLATSAAVTVTITDQYGMSTTKTFSPIHEKQGDARFVDVCAGDTSACALSDNGEIRCLGGSYGEGNPPAGPFASLACGLFHTCGIRPDGRAECWGRNVTGEATPPDERFVTIASGWFSNCGLTQDGRTVCWGSDTSSFEAGHFTALTVGGEPACGLQPDGHAACWGRNDYGQATPPANETFSKISQGWFCGWGLRGDGSLAFWGSCDSPPNGGFGPYQDIHTAIAFDTTCALDMQGIASCWGRNDNGQADAPANVEFTRVRAGDSMSCGLRRDGRVQCWMEGAGLVLSSDGSVSPL